MIDILELCYLYDRLNMIRVEERKEALLGALHLKLTRCPANFVQVLGRALCGDEGEECIFGEALFVPDPVIDV